MPRGGQLLGMKKGPVSALSSCVSCLYFFPKSFREKRKGKLYITNFRNIREKGKYGIFLFSCRPVRIQKSFIYQKIEFPF
jgi:hypothetical protein